MRFLSMRYNLSIILLSIFYYYTSFQYVCLSLSDPDAEGARSLIFLTSARQQHHVFCLAGHYPKLVTFCRRQLVMLLPVILEVV